MERTVYRILLMLCFLGISFGQSFNPNIWTIDPEPTKNVNVSGMTFFHSTSGDTSSLVFGDKNSNRSDFQIPLFSQFQSDGVLTQSNSQREPSNNFANLLGTQQSGGTFAIGQRPHGSLAVPVDIVETPSSPVGNDLKTPVLRQGSSSSNVFLGASNIDSKSSDFTIPERKPATNQKKPWPYTFTDSRTNDESTVNLNALGIKDNPVSTGGDISSRGAFMTGISDEKSRKDNAFSSGSFSSTTEDINNTQRKGPKLKMSVSGKFVDHSNKPIFRVKTKFVDKYTDHTPGLKAESDFGDKPTNKPLPTQPTAGSQRSPSVPTKDPEKNVEPFNRIADTANTEVDSNINFVDLAANTPENVGQYTTTTVGQSMTTERGNTTPATTTTSPVVTNGSKMETKPSIPRSTNLKIESLYPEAPFPISNSASSPSGNTDKSAILDTKSEDNAVADIKTTANTIGIQSKSKNNLNQFDNELPSSLDSSLTDTNNLSNGNSDLPSKRNDERFAQDNINGDNNNIPQSQSNQGTRDTQVPNVHVPFVTHHAAASGNIDQFKTDPNVQIINQGGVNAPPMNSNSMSQKNPRVPDFSNINGQQISANGVARLPGSTGDANQFLSTGQGQRMVGQTGNSFGQTNTGFQSNSMSFGRMAGTRTSTNQFNQSNRPGFQNFPGNFNNGNSGQNTFMNANAFNGANRGNVDSQIQNNAINLPVNRIGNGFLSRNGGFPVQSLDSRQNLNRQFSGNTITNANDINRNGLPSVNMISGKSNPVAFNGQQQPNNNRQLINNVDQRFSTGTSQNSFASSGNMNNKPVANLPSNNVNQLSVVENQVTLTNSNSNGLVANVQNEFRNVPTSNNRRPMATGNAIVTGNNDIPLSPDGQKSINNNIGFNRNRVMPGNMQASNNPADLGNIGVRPGGSGTAINAGGTASSPSLIARNKVASGSSGMDLGTASGGTMPGNSQSTTGQANRANQNTKDIGASSNRISSVDNGFNDRFSLGMQSSGNINPQMATQNKNGNSNFIGNFPQNRRGPSVGQQQFSKSFISSNVGNGMAQNTNRISQTQTAMNSNRQGNSLMMGSSMDTFNNNNNFRNPPFASQQRNNRETLQEFSSFQNGFQSQRNNFFPSPQNSRSFTDIPQNRFNNFINRNVQPIPTNFQSAPFGANVNQLSSQQAQLSRTRGFPASQQQFLQRNSMNVFPQNRQVMPFG